MEREQTKQWEPQTEVNSVSEYAKQGKDTQKKREKEREGRDKHSLAGKLLSV